MAKRHRPYSKKKSGTDHKKFFQKLVDTIKDPTTKQILEKSLDFTSGIEQVLRNPDQLLWDKNTGLRFYDTMMMDDRINSIINLKKKMALSVEASVIPASDEDEALERADFLNNMINTMTFRWNDILDNFLDAMVYGFKVGEKIWKIEDNKWIVKNIRLKHSQFFDFKYDTFSNLEKLMIGYYYGSLTTIEGFEKIASKFMILTYPYPKDGNYYGESDLSQLFTLYNQKWNILRWRGVYLQNYAMPIPIIKFDKDKADDTEIADVEETFDNWQDSMYLMIPSIRDQESGELRAKFEVEWKKAETSKGAKAYDEAIDQLDAQIARKLLIPDKMGFSESDGGSYALGIKQFEIMVMTIKELHEKLERLINPMLAQVELLNFPNVEEFSKYKFTDITKNIEKELLKLIIESGVVDKREKWIRSYLGIPELTIEEQQEIDKAKEEDIRKAQQQMINNNDDDEKEKDQNKKDDKLKEMKRANDPVNFKKIDRQYETFETEFIKSYGEIHKQQSENLVKQVQKKKIIETGDLKKVDELRIKKTDLKRLMNIYYAKLYMTGKVDAIDEIDGRWQKALKALFKNDILDPDKKTFQIEDEIEWLDRTFIDSFLADSGELGKLTKADIVYLKQLRDQAFFITGDIETRMVKEVRNALKTGLDAGAPGVTIIKNMEQILTEDRKKFATTIARTNASDAYNTGRLNVFTSNAVRPTLEAYRYTAILDNVTTLFCESHDGQVLRADDPRVSLINPPNHFNCRSILDVIFIGESQDPNSFYSNYEDRLEPWGTDVPVIARLPAKGFGGR